MNDKVIISVLTIVWEIDAYAKWVVRPVRPSLSHEWTLVSLCLLELSSNEVNVAWVDGAANVYAFVVVIVIVLTSREVSEA